MRLFCIPYAGGNAWSYRALERHVSPGVTLEGLELPGRGRRGLERLCTSLDELADDVFRQIEARAVTGRYAIYGHSMGALLAYLTAHRIRRAGLTPPESLFLSGSSAPRAPRERERHLLPPAEFVTMLRELGGCPPQVLEDAEMLEFFEPILRADFKAVETWHAPPAPPLDVPLVVMVGDDDEATAADVAGWAAETTAPCRMVEFSGDHFFILRHWEAIGATIQRQLFGATPPPPLALRRAGAWQ
jgi:surfactin synthase thioesterase subunit